MATLLQGKQLTGKIKATLEADIKEFAQRTGSAPVLASIEVGDNKGVGIYTSMQKKAAEGLGIEYRLKHFTGSTTEKELIGQVKQLNSDDSVNGIIVQLPCPAHIDDRKISQGIRVDKDVEGIHPENLGKLLLGQARFIPCTAAAVMELINATGIDLSGKNAVIVGRSEIVGKPLIFLLLEKSPTVTICHSGTSKAGKLEEFVRSADILVAAIGRPALIKGSWIKEGAIVIDVGINQVGDTLIGDIEFSTAMTRASFITPVPGGVGPLTVFMLMRNLINAAKLQKGISG
ncbi:MAG: bifunctional 5,10-methylenetetrahydrofolate dehydrogenase/5,10-methenyltetrahydrofolate cyclohydrolase [Candidatus Omnitrophota bacterium]|nr:MAG: bifunctional 5,10-methylenetetrahydrofolate dehydrogenase/5,10-methenyltetrahydrofolate cyclohydrolase [Candidatus Omnitrophota bacterium]